jgi:hypothetical protein
MTAKKIKPALLLLAICAVGLLGYGTPADAQREQPQRRQGQQQHQSEASKQEPREQPQRGGAQKKEPQIRDEQQRRDQQQNEKQRQKQVEKQQKRFEKYEDRLEKQQPVADRKQRWLEEKNRRSHARYQERYQEFMRERRNDLRDKHDHDLRNDPFFDAPPIYRYYRGGRYYDINRYVGQVLREAVDFGYEQGFLAGRADYEDGWRFSYSDCYAYEDATYGYTGYYVDLKEYRYYFREGFRRGYEDGYYHVYHYGRYEDGKYRILADILVHILYLMPLP